MNNLLVIKLVLGTTAILGGSTVSTYFGTKTTIEQHLTKTSNLKKIEIESKWTENVNKIKKNADSSPKTESFKSLEGKNGTELKDECNKELNKIYEVFWRKQELDSNLKNDLETYCFSNS